jgi:hypothetical protein
LEKRDKIRKIEEVPEEKHTFPAFALAFRNASGR